MKRSPNASIEQLRGAFLLDAETGHVFWKIQRGPSKPGDLAGASTPGSYCTIMFRGKPYNRHRIVWALAHGKWPDAEIDHINLDRGDDRLVNLREATRSQNEFNKRPACNNTSGHRGVRWDRQVRKWGAYYHLNKKYVHLGFFADKDEAVRVRSDAVKRVVGEFARGSE